VIGSKLANEPSVFPPQTRPLSSESSAVSRDTDVLTGETPDDDIDGNSVCRQSLCGEFSNVSIYGHLRPMLVEDFDGERLDLAEGDGLEPARALKAEIEAANAGEK
jgi:hypothetical protein